MCALTIRREDPALFEAKAHELRLEIDRIAERIKRVDAACLGTVDLEVSPQELRYVEVLGGFEPSCMMRELADRAQVPGYLVDGADDLRREWFEGRNTVGVTAGASAPEQLVQEVVVRLREWGGAPPAESYGRSEHVVFALPRALR